MAADAFAAMKEQMGSGHGFIAALDQSGGSTPKALRLYGVTEDMYDGEEAMFDAIHDMRARIILAPDFTSEKVIGAILFERTMRGAINGKPVAQLLWEDRGIVPFLKIDKGLEDKADGAQLMKPMPGLEALLAESPAKRRKWIQDRADRKLTDKVHKVTKEAATLEDLHAAFSQGESFGHIVD